MNKYDAITIVALLIFIAVVPIYAWREPQRLATAQAGLQQRIISEAATIYLENCAECHDTTGTGIGITPSLRSPTLVNASVEAITNIIARASHGSPMAAWHIASGGILNDYQIAELVTLIRSDDWQIVAEEAERQQVVIAEITPTDIEATFLLNEEASDPHVCAACHEEPEVHADRFGLNCGRCHNAQSWQPALLNRHTFPLDHGGDGAVEISCQTCHLANYQEHTCYGCHDHQPVDMEEVHLSEGITSVENCVECHPTGIEGEAVQVAAIKFGLPGLNIGNDTK